MAHLQVSNGIASHFLVVDKPEIRAHDQLVYPERQRKINYKLLIYTNHYTI